MSSYLGNYTDSLNKTVKDYRITTYTIRDNIRSEIDEDFDRLYLPNSYFLFLREYSDRSCTHWGLVKPRQLVLNIGNNYRLYAGLIHKEGSLELANIIRDLNDNDILFSIYGEALSYSYLNIFLNR